MRFEIWKNSRLISLTGSGKVAAVALRKGYVVRVRVN